MQDRLNMTQSLNHRLGLTDISLPGAQPVTVAMVQSDQITTNIPNHSPISMVTGQQDDYDYQDYREEELYQIDGTTDVQHLLTIQMIMKIMSKVIMHVKDKEKYMPQLMQLCKAQPHYASLGYPFCNTAAHT